MTTPKPDPDALVHAARDIIMVAALVGAAVALALGEHGELAATALGGALGLAVPASRSRALPSGALVIGLALAGGAILGGCGATPSVVKVTRAVCDVVVPACALVPSSGGEAP